MSNEPNGAAKGRLLILDDDPSVGRTIALVAESIGFEVRALTRPEEFLDAVDHWLPTHIALDLVMPQMDGVEVMRLLAQRGCRAHVIISSGVGGRVLDSARRAAAAQGLNIVDVLAKPFSPAALRRLLSSRTGGAEDGSTGSGTSDHEDFVFGERELRAALERKQFHLVYQPIIHCRTRRPAGFEALVRWHPAPGRIVTPDRFIPLAESANLIGSLTDQVTEQALRWFSGRQGEVPGALTLAINLSAKVLADAGLADRVAGQCAALGVEPGRIVFELTESSAMDDPVTSLALLTRLRMKGFQLSIDDFGTGFSSMVQLVRLPFSEMKVDRSFVSAVTTSAEARTVTKSIVDLGQSLGLRVVAEGVEDADTLDFISGVGCDFAQGYLISRPLNAETAAAWLRRPVFAPAED